MRERERKTDRQTEKQGEMGCSEEEAADLNVGNNSFCALIKTSHQRNEMFTKRKEKLFSFDP